MLQNRSLQDIKQNGLLHVKPYLWEKKSTNFISTFIPSMLLCTSQFPAHRKPACHNNSEVIILLSSTLAFYACGNCSTKEHLNMGLKGSLQKVQSRNRFTTSPGARKGNCRHFFLTSLLQKNIVYNECKTLHDKYNSYPNEHTQQNKSVYLWHNGISRWESHQVQGCCNEPVQTFQSSWSFSYSRIHCHF